MFYFIGKNCIFDKSCHIIIDDRKVTRCEPCMRFRTASLSHQHRLRKANGSEKTPLVVVINMMFDKRWRGLNYSIMS